MSQINNEMIHKLKYIKLFILIKASDIGHFVGNFYCCTITHFLPRSHLVLEWFEMVPGLF